MDTLVFVLEVRDDFFEVIFTQGCEYLFLILSAYDDMTKWSSSYFINFSIEFIRRIFYYIWLFEYIYNYSSPLPCPILIHQYYSIRVLGQLNEAFIWEKILILTQKLRWFWVLANFLRIWIPSWSTPLFLTLASQPLLLPFSIAWEQQNQTPLSSSYIQRICIPYWPRDQGLNRVFLSWTMRWGVFWPRSPALLLFEDWRFSVCSCPQGLLVYTLCLNMSKLYHFQCSQALEGHQGLDIQLSCLIVLQFRWHFLDEE